MICNQGELGSVEVDMKLLHAPYNGEALELSDGVILLGIGERTREEDNEVFLTSVIVLGEDSSEASYTSIGV